MLHRGNSRYFNICSISLSVIYKPLDCDNTFLYKWYNLFYVVFHAVNAYTASDCTLETSRKDLLEVSGLV